MSSAAAEIRKLAHQLGVTTAELDFLAGLAPDDLRELRCRIGDHLFEADRHHFTKVAAVSRLVPNAIAAKVTEFALPPLIAARTAELLEPAKAADMVGRLSDGYLADVSAALDPTRCPEVIAHIPPSNVAKVGAELARRKEWVVMGGFVSVLSAAALRAAVAELDGEALLHIGYVLDDLSRMDEIVQMLTDAQLDQMLRGAAEQQLWAELDGVLSYLTGPQSGRIAQRCKVAPDDIRAAIAAAALRTSARTALAL
ncbi:MAG TPA: hypothetical protein VGH43_00925 [Jatrophihabitans sp.]|jgi:hypothetical protein